MRKIFYLLLLLLVNRFDTKSQTIKGKVYDSETKEPVVGANIQLVRSGFKTLTNSEGKFLIKILEKTDSISVSFTGYESVTVLADEQTNIPLRPNAQQLQHIVVTANRDASLRSQTPVAISRLSARLIDETKANQVHEIINKTPGVMMPSYNNEQHGMAIRQPMGTSAYYLYMEDGVPIRPLGIFNHNALLEVNQFAISSIEVVKGPVSSIYGPEAVGGTINFITQKPTAVPSGRIGIQADNWGFRRVQFGAGATIKKIGFYVGGLSSLQTNSWMTASDYNKTSVNVSLEYNFSEKTRLSGMLIYGKYYSQMSGSIDSTAFYKRQYVSTSDFTYRKSDAYRSRITLEHDWNSKSKTFVTLFQRNNKHGQNPSYAIRWSPTPTAALPDPTKAIGEINSNDFESYGVIAQHSRHFKLLQSKLIVGGVMDITTNNYWSYRLDLNAQLDPANKFVERYTIEKERPDMPISNYKGNIKNYATYLQYEFIPLKNLRISFGGRYDVMDLDYINNINFTSGRITYKRVTPKIGAVYNFSQNGGIYANYSQGFSPPSLTAIFRPRPNINPVQFYTNLSPAIFNNYEIGGWVTLWKNKVYIDVSLYELKGTNELLNIRQPDNSFDFLSAGMTLHRGIEFGMTARPSSEYSFRFGGTNALHRFDDFQISNRSTDQYQNLKGFEMPSSPRWSWNTELSYYPKWLKKFRTSMEWQFVSGWYQNQINTVRQEGYHLLNYRVGYAWKGVEWYANVMNVTNALYATSVTRGNNPSDRSFFNPGAPRTFVFGVQYNFSGKK